MRFQVNPPWSGLLPITKEEDQDVELWRVIDIGGSSVTVYMKGEVCTIDDEVDKLIAEAKSKWEEAGYSSRLCEAGVERAVAWAAKMADFASPTKEDAIRSFKHVLPKALEHSKDWMEGLVGFFRR